MSETKLKPFIADQLLASLQPEIEEESQVILHCCVKSQSFFQEKIRIWSSTYLVDRTLEHVSKLIHFENITLFPEWTDIADGKEYWFTLVFSGLPKDCKVFDFLELIPQNGGFFCEGITRNSSDVYKIILDI